jgi:hypothetical protein
MKNLKTYEGFFDFFKKKESEDDKIAQGYLKRLEHLKSFLEKGEVSPYEIDFSEHNSDADRSYLRYTFTFDDGAVRICKAEADKKFNNGWAEETQKDFIDQGCVKKNNHVLYMLDIKRVDECVIADWTILEELFELAQWCFNKNKQNIRINRIKGDINPSADLLDDDIWGDTPLDKR